MKTHLHVLVPASTTLSGIVDAMNALLAPHRLKDDDTIQPNWRFDYLCLFDATLCCEETDAELPAEMHDYRGYVSRVDRLRNDISNDVSVGAVVTPDGVWHDIDDFGHRMMNPAELNEAALKKWSRYYWKLLEDNPDCWVIETWTHS
ncbi:hypothetical protein [Gimesia sp.]|uniref:hypothetical protein n=1 Tax=Gimesia sp. TaxID=2024833 RepID=UPI003A93F714